MTRALTLRYALPLLLCLTACAADDAGSTTQSSSTVSPTTAPPVDGVPQPSVRPRADNRPEFNVAAPEDATAAEITELVAAGMLPLAPTHGGAFETMVNSIDAQPAFDVVIFGDSMVQQGVDPTVMSGLLSQGGSDVTVMNGASSRARWGINLMLARHLAQQDKTPRVALIGITTRAGENDLFYSTEASKTPFSALVEGCDRPRTTSWTAEAEQDCLRSIDDPVFRFRNGGGQIERARSGKTPQTNLYLDRDSWLRSDGYIVHPGVSVAEVTAVSDERMERGFPGFPTNAERATEEFVAMVDLLEKHGTTVVSFEVPYTPVHQQNLNEIGRNYDARRQMVASALAEAADIRHISVSRFGPWWGDGDSRDAIHLAPRGAAKFTEQLLEDPTLAKQLRTALDS